jgi:hypothetical protein
VAGQSIAGGESELVRSNSLYINRLANRTYSNTNNTGISNVCHGGFGIPPISIGMVTEGATRVGLCVWFALIRVAAIFLRGLTS